MGTPIKVTVGNNGNNPVVALTYGDNTAVPLTVMNATIGQSGGNTNINYQMNTNDNVFVTDCTDLRSSSTLTSSLNQTNFLYLITNCAVSVTCCAQGPTPLHLPNRSCPTSHTLLVHLINYTTPGGGHV